ncbi:MAG: hypothetical protein HRT45_01955 [Bdellovibrionales bacterium]|nr:hypothetical protein [Bdellovibrionales bacterium]
MKRLLSSIALLLVVATVASLAWADPHPYFARCDVNLKSHAPMSEQDLQVEVGYLMRELHFEAAEDIGVGYHTYYAHFPDLQWRLTKDPNFHWVDTYGKIGRTVADYLKGMSNKNRNRIEHRARLRREGFTEAEIADRVRPLRRVPSVTVMSPFEFMNTKPDPTKFWYQGIDWSATHEYHAGVPLKDYPLFLRAPADLITDFEGVLSKFVDLSGTFNILFGDVANTPGQLMFTLDEEKTLIVDKQGNPVSISDYIGMMKGVSTVPWSTGEQTPGAFYLRKDSDDFSVPRLKLIYLDGSSVLPTRVYSLVD